MRIIFAIILISVFLRVKSNDEVISCETIEKCLDFNNCCFGNSTVTIETENSSFAGEEDDNVQAIWFANNKNIKYLPNRVHMRFPEISVYNAENCAIRRITMQNFENLISLESVNFAGNLIEVIDSDTFADNLILDRIDLGRNRIRSINSELFESIMFLNAVLLESNQCVNENFFGDNAMDSIGSKIDDQCKILNNIYEISCVSLSNHCINWSSGRCCDMSRKIEIRNENAKISGEADPEVIRMHFSLNKAIRFLPISLSTKFPNIIHYWARSCSIQKISKLNFVGLTKLKHLWLASNEIETVRSDTFEDLDNLENINLAENKIKSMNGNLFKKLPNLKSVNLVSNECISKKFEGYRLPSLVRVVTNKCGYTETETSGNEVSCFAIEPCRELKTCCRMTSPINSSDFMIADQKNEEVKGIYFVEVKEIEFLPIFVYHKFPHLQGYAAYNCSIREISKKNFERLTRLINIYLPGNKLEKIPSDTFDGLINLEFINLDRNRIKFLNGRLFEGLPDLERVYLNSNECIDEEFMGDARIQHLSRIVTEKCAFTEAGSRFSKVFDIDCGIITGGTGLIIGGTGTKRGQWPFMAALMLIETNKFFCGGNVITPKHILTAAHCVHQKYDSALKADSILVLLGRHNLQVTAERGSETRTAEKISVHPDWKPDDPKYDADLAIIHLDRNVEFSAFIQPVCLSNDKDVLQHDDGYVVGWGRSEDKTKLHEESPKQVLMRAVNSSYCFEKEHRLGSMYSSRMYCAGGYGAGPCAGDSGGGFFVKFRGLWTLRGAVSSALLDEARNCDVERFTLFTKVTDFGTWIKNTVGSTHRTVDELIEEVFGHKLSNDHSVSIRWH